MLRLDSVSLPPLGKSKRDASVLFARCDLLHKGYGGNKWYKLNAFADTFDQCLARKACGTPYTLFAIGGAYSNLIAALTQYASEAALTVDFIVRGERPADHKLSPALRTAISQGHNLHFVPRSTYRSINELSRSGTQSLATGSSPHAYLQNLSAVPESDSFFIPEGAGGLHGGLGGAMLYRDICSALKAADRSELIRHIIHAAGTGSTVAGLAAASTHDANNSFNVHAIPVLRAGEVFVRSTQQLYRYVLAHLKAADKSCFELSVKEQTNEPSNRDLGVLFPEEDFSHGGYAKQSEPLNRFISEFNDLNKLEIDRIYVAKVLYAVRVMLDNGMLPPEQTLVVNSALSTAYPWAEPLNCTQ